MTTKLTLQAVLQAHGLDIGTIATVQTEVVGDAGERPDLVGSKEKWQCLTSSTY